ncbi:MAG: alpha-ketoacid dehydrogenase subunit beta [Gammaproteobacteria bacterium]
MLEITVNEAIAQALAEEMRRDTRVMMFGEGVATKRHDLVKEFGDKRVRNTPLAEGIIAGTAVGAAATGMRPVIDLLFAPFLCYAMDGIVNSAGKLRYISGGQFAFPLVVISMTGSGWTVGAQHNHNIESWFVHSPGLKVVMPSTPADYKGLLKAAIRDDNPVLFFVDMALGHQTGLVAEGDYVIPLGQASILRDGVDISIISYAKTVHTCLKAAELLTNEGISAEVIDLRTLKPLDEMTILDSARKTGRVLIVHEANRMCGVGAEVAAIVAEHAFPALKSPLMRLTSQDTPAPSSYVLEQAFMPKADVVVEAARKLLEQRV